MTPVGARLAGGTHVRLLRLYTRMTGIAAAIRLITSGLLKLPH